VVWRQQVDQNIVRASKAGSASFADVVLHPGNCRPLRLQPATA
jgi:hypothetical protein